MPFTHPTPHPEIECSVNVCQRSNESWTLLEHLKPYQNVVWMFTPWLHIIRLFLAGWPFTAGNHLIEVAVSVGFDCTLIYHWHVCVPTELRMNTTASCIATTFTKGLLSSDNWKWGWNENILKYESEVECSCCIAKRGVKQHLKVRFKWKIFCNWNWGWMQFLPETKC